MSAYVSSTHPLTNATTPNQPILPSKLPYPQRNVRRERADQEHGQDRRPVLVVVHALRAALAEVPRAVDENNGRVRDRDERDGREEPRADQPDRVARRDKVEERRRDRADVDPKVQPFLGGCAGMSAGVATLRR